MFLGLCKILDVGLGLLVLHLDLLFQLLHIFGHLALGLPLLVPELSVGLLKFLNLRSHLFVAVLERKILVVHILDLRIEFVDLVLIHLHVILNKLDELLNIDFLSLGHFCFQVLILLLD